MEKVLVQKQVNDIYIVNFNDVKRFNVTLAEQVKTEIIALLAEGKKKIVFDLAGVTFIDSSGFGALVSVFNNAKENEAIFKICNISVEAMELVQVTKLDKVFSICQTLDECLSNF